MSSLKSYSSFVGDRHIILPRKKREKHSVIVVAVIGILALLLFSSIAVLLGSGNLKENMMKKISNGGIRGYTPHDVIRINNNTDFANQAASENWSGDGSQGNPYIISGYDIDAHGAGAAIYVGNTTVYFIIENCQVYNTTQVSVPYYSGDGIILYNAANGVIRNCISSDNGVDGIMIDSSCNIRVENTTSHHNDGGSGLRLTYSRNIILYNVSCTNNFWSGIEFYHSDYNTLHNSSVKYTVYSNGIHLDSSKYNHLENNTIYHNPMSGIYLDSSNNNIITYNNISDNGKYGIYSDSSSGNRIYGNSFYYNQGSGNSYSSSHIQAYSLNSSDLWNNSKIGNYWHDWANNNDTNDQNNDGIVDWAYKIDGSAGAKDYYPLKNPIQPVPEFSTGIWLFIVVLIALLGVVRFRKFS